MNSEHETLKIFELLSQVKIHPVKRQEIWDALEERIDRTGEGRNLGRRKTRWGVTSAAVAAIVVAACSVAALTSIPKLRHAENQLATHAENRKPVLTSLNISQLAPATDTQSFLYAQSAYASPNGQFVAIWKTDSSGVTTWVEDMNGHEWFVARGKNYIVGSTPSGGILFSTQQPNQDPTRTFPEFVYQPGQTGTRTIPADGQARLTQYATQSVSRTWATIESGSTTTADYDSWVDVNGQKIGGLDHAVKIAWSPDGSMLAALVSVDASPKGGNPWSVIQNAVVTYNLKTKQVSRSSEFFMSGLSWSPDGKVIAADCIEDTPTFGPGLYEFQADNLQTVQPFNVLPYDWSWLGEHTALVSDHQNGPSTWNLILASWEIQTGKTSTAIISGVSGQIRSVRDAGFERCLVQDDEGLMVISGSRATRIVNQPVQAWWYDSSTHEVYYVPTKTEQVWKIVL